MVGYGVSYSGGDNDDASERPASRIRHAALAERRRDRMARHLAVYGEVERLCEELGRILRAPEARP